MSIMKKCPGIDEKYIKVEIHICQNCGYEVEIFSDEIKVLCPKCKTEIFRENTPSCIDWCQHARECIGERRWQELKKRIDDTQQKGDFKEKILLEMRKYFGSDSKRIQHSQKVTQYAEQILQKENGDRNVVIASAILHDIGIKECEKKYNSSDGQLQEKEGPQIARNILEKLSIRPEIIDEVCSIIASHHSPGEIDTLSFKILWDSDWLVNLKDEYDLEDKEKLKKIINKIFLTQTGKKIAEEIYL